MLYVSGIMARPAGCMNPMCNKCMECEIDMCMRCACWREYHCDGSYCQRCETRFHKFVSRTHPFAVSMFLDKFCGTMRTGSPSDIKKMLIQIVRDVKFGKISQGSIDIYGVVFKFQDVETVVERVTFFLDKIYTRDTGEFADDLNDFVCRIYYNENTLNQQTVSSVSHAHDMEDFWGNTDIGDHGRHHRRKAPSYPVSSYPVAPTHEVQAQACAGTFNDRLRVQQIQAARATESRSFYDQSLVQRVQAARAAGSRLPEPDERSPCQAARATGCRLPDADERPPVYQAARSTGRQRKPDEDDMWRYINFI